MFALERLGARARLTNDVSAVEEADRLILPGVGAAGYAMGRLQASGLVQTLMDFPRPMLGVCLGQQLLFEESDESPGTPLLGLIPGKVRALKPAPGLTVPHTGWSELRLDRPDPLLDGVSDGDWAYFVPGYVCPDTDATLAHVVHGQGIPAIVRSGNRWGCQFHPERSSTTGARILENFLRLPV